MSMRLRLLLLMLLGSGLPFSVWSKPSRSVLIKGPTGIIDTLPAPEVEAIPYLSITETFRRAGFACSYDSGRGVLTCVSEKDTVRFFRDLSVHSVNGKSRQLLVPVAEREGLLILPPFCVAEALRASTRDSVVWTDSLLLLTIVPQKSPLSASPKKNSVASSAVARINDYTIRNIVIDPGHGGKDPGAIGPGGTQEKDVVLGISLALRDKLKRVKDLNVFMTRETDIFIPLNKRTKFANDKKADLFISIHANSIGGTRQKRNETKGFKIYFLSHAKNEEDKLVAMRENSVIELEAESEQKGYLQNILIDLAGNEYLAESQDMSILVAETFQSSLSKIKKLHLGVGQANFFVLNGAYMPAILIETGFISHPDEEKLLADRRFQDELAQAIFTAIMEFKRKYDQIVAEG